MIRPSSDNENDDAGNDGDGDDDDDGDDAGDDGDVGNQDDDNGERVTVDHPSARLTLPQVPPASAC